ncbi:MAG: proline--tRNA ligase [Clostridia bacterium]|nr:proline--tRNA ligase [Clostridia bacterium]
MKVSSLLGERLKTVSDDIAIESQSLMLRGGYIKNVGNGIYSFYPLAQRISRKIQNIIRQEMDAIDGQEVLFPVVMPASLWQESGRYYSIGAEMARFKDRSGADLVLGMTHEEASVHLAKNTAKSYTQYPFMIYQIQTKFRDEARARGGLIRVREFTMKDGYSFHTSQEDLEKYYYRCFDAYDRIFKRVGLKNFVAVKSDSGMMGGSVSHEFMLLTPIGEDTLAICSDEKCGYRANMEAAQTVVNNIGGEVEELKEVSTPSVKTIDDLCAFLKTDAKKLCKAVVYQINEDDSYVVVFVRGDLEVNETKLRNYLKKEIHKAQEITVESGIVAGFIGPKDFKGKAKVLYDSSLIGINSLISGANKNDTHVTGLNIERDIGKVEYVDLSKIYEGAICPKCGKPTITLSNGIEIGNIFQLGTKYSKSMNMTYVDENNTPQYPIMGCYGIGVGRLIASICEESHDKFGPIWPISVAPFDVEICNLRADDDEVNKVCEELYETLPRMGYDVLYDDRNIRPGSMFADADLFGCPIRVIVSPKNLANGVVEIVTRDKSFRIEKPVSEAAEQVMFLAIKLEQEYKIK